MMSFGRETVEKAGRTEWGVSKREMRSRVKKTREKIRTKQLQAGVNLEEKRTYLKTRKEGPGGAEYRNL